MAEPDAFDPTHTLDGWRPPAPAPLQELDLQALLQAAARRPDLADLPLVASRAPVPDALDPTHLLDGWRAPAPAPLDLQLGALRRAEGAGLDRDKLARLKARGYEMVDIEDIEVRERPPARPRVELPVMATPPPAEIDARMLLDEDEPADAPPAAFFAEAAVLDVPAPAPPAEADPPPWVEPVRLFEEEPPAALPGFTDDGSAASESMPAQAAMAEDTTPEEPTPIDMGAITEEAAPLESDAATTPQPLVEDTVAPGTLANAPGPQPDAAPPIEAEGIVPAEVPRPEPVDGLTLDFHAPPPAVPDAQWLQQAIRLPQAPSPIAFETPVLDFHAPLPDESDPRRVIEAVELPVVRPQPASTTAPELDIAALNPRVEADPRLLAQWQPSAWMALVRQVAEASTEVLQTQDGPQVKSHAPQWLCAVWPPQRPEAPWLGCWPELAGLVAAGTKQDALQILLPELPAEAKLWSADLEPDWSQVAELVLQQDAELNPVQARRLRELADAERAASLARLGSGYQSLGRIARRRP